jgi:hypothetical protein
MMSRPPITERPAYGHSRGGNHPKTLRGPVGKEKPAGTAQSYRGSGTSLRHYSLSSRNSVATSSCRFV